MIIDAYCHHVSKPVIDRIEKGRWLHAGQTPDKDAMKKFLCPDNNGDPEVRLGHMAKYGVDIQALSLTTETLDGFSAAEAADICRTANNDNYALCKVYPNKFVNVCAFSLLDPKNALNELERSINELDCRGAVVSTNQNGKGLDSPEYFPFYKILEEHALPLFLHPTNWTGYPLVDESQWVFMSRFGWPFDSTQAVWRLIFGGVLDRFPALNIVMHHLGALFPYFSGRIESGMMRLKQGLPRPMSEYWKNIYGDSALSGGLPEAFALGYAFFGPDRVLYGSDYPFGQESGEKFMRTNLAGLTSLKIPDADKQKVLADNAKRLLKIK